MYMYAVCCVYNEYSRHEWLNWVLIWLVGSLVVGGGYGGGDAGGGVMVVFAGLRLDP